MGSKHNFSKVVSSKKVEWYTPLDLHEEVRRFLGEIDLDPARPDLENGLMQTWCGRVFLNPPYGRHIKKWIDKALSDPVDEIVLLVPSNTASRWFQPFFQHCICFISRRLIFSGSGRIAPFPSVLVYRGPRTEEFKHAFSHLGHVVIGEGAEPVAYQLPLELSLVS